MNAITTYSSFSNGVEIVHCNADYGHDYPFANSIKPYIGGTRIIWNFMKNHKRVG